MSYTYIMKNDFGLIKVGNSINPERRREDLKSSSGTGVELICVKKGYHLESLVQEKLKEHKTHGEWFSCTLEQAVQALEEAKEEHDNRIQRLRDKINIGPDEEELFAKAAEPSFLRTKEEMDAIKQLMLNKLLELTGTQAHLGKMLNVQTGTVQGWVMRGQISKSGARKIEDNPSLSAIFKPKDLRPDL